MMKIKNTILVVEDDICLQTILERIFHAIDKSLKFDWVTSAEEAKLALKAEKYSLVIADHNLSGDLSGLDLWDICQAEYPGLSFILISSIGVQDFFKTVGPHRISPLFLPKPFYASECKQLLESLLPLHTQVDAHRFR